MPCSNARPRRTIERATKGRFGDGCRLHPGVRDHRSRDDELRLRQGKIGEGPFEGLIVHTAGFDDEAGVFRILDVWETREHADRFLAEHVQPLIDEGPGAFPNPEAFAIPTRDGFYDLHDVVQPALAHH